MKIRLQPGARREQVIGYADGLLRVAVQAPPVEGAANRALVEFLARYFHTRRSKVLLVQGEKSRIKTVELVDVTEDSLEQQLKKLIPNEPKGDQGP